MIAPDPREAQRLRQFLKTLLGMAVFFTALDLVALAVSHDWRIGAGAVASAGAGVAVVVALRYLGRGRQDRAVITVCLALYAVVLVLTPVQPEIFPTFAIAPALVAAVALPYLRGQPLRWILATSLPVSISAALIGEFFPRPAQPHPWTMKLISVTSLAAAVFLLVMFLFQFSSRIREALERSEEAVRARDDFISTASHELRTPLTTLALQVQALHRATAQENPALAAKAQQAVQSTARLETLIQQLLDVSRMSAGRLPLELEQVDLAALVSAVAARSGEQVARSGSALTLRAASPVVGRWDRMRLEQVVANLLSNAVRYGQGKPIEIHVEAGAGSARLVVRDQGVGISPEDQARIFERFERAVSARHYGGFGLGLWIARRALEDMGGSIRVASAPNAGSTFTVELPTRTS